MVSIVSPKDKRAVTGPFTVRLSFSTVYDNTHSLKLYYNDLETSTHKLGTSISVTAIPFSSSTKFTLAVAVVKGDTIVASSERIRLSYEPPVSSVVNKQQSDPQVAATPHQLPDDSDETSELRFIKNY